MSLPYYKRFPRDFLEGTISLPFEVKCAYSVVLDLIYMKDGRLPDEPRFIAGHLGCSVRKWTAIRAALIEAGKLTVSDGIISNFRADYLTEETRKYQDNQAEIAGKPRKNNGLQQPKPSQPEPEPEEYSVPNGTGETPISNEPLDDLAELRVLEPKAAAWAISRKVLCERGGLNRAKAGEIVGKLFKDHGLTPGELWEAAEATWKAGTENPIPYLTRLCASAANKRGGADNLEPSERQQIAWMQDWIESPANWRGTRGPRPGEPGCRVRPEIQYRFGVRPETANDTPKPDLFAEGESA